MMISSKYVGAACAPLELEATPRLGMNFAAALGDENPWYLDDTRAEGTVIPPMAAISLTWKISERFTEFWQGANFPYEALSRQVHYSESLEWRRMIQPGERLRIEGTVAAILPHRAGTHLIIRYTAKDFRGDTVFIEHIGGLLRGIPCEDQGSGVDSVPECSGIRADTPLWEKTLSIHPLAAHWYDGCADIHFPIHTSPAFAKMVGLPGILYQGAATLSLAVREILDREAGGDPRRLRAAHARFTGMVRPGTDIQARLLDKEVREAACICYFVVLNKHQKKALSDGRVVLAVP